MLYPVPAPDPASVAHSSGIAENIEMILSTLPKRSREMLEEHFGLRDGVPKGFGEVGRLFGVSREGARRIVARSLCMLRKPEVLKLLDGRGNGEPFPPPR